MKKKILQIMLILMAAAPAFAEIPVYSSEPANPATGEIWYNVTLGEWHGKRAQGTAKLVTQSGPTFTPIQNQLGNEGTVYTLNLSNYFTGISLTYAATGLPSGLSLDPTTGILSGTLPQVVSDSDYSVSVTATDSSQLSSSQTFTLTVTNINSSGIMIAGDNTDYTTTLGFPFQILGSKIVCIFKTASWPSSENTMNAVRAKFISPSTYGSIPTRVAIYTSGANPKTLLGYTELLSPAAGQVTTFNFTSPVMLTKGTKYGICVFTDGYSYVYAANGNGVNGIGYGADQVWNNTPDHIPPPTFNGYGNYPYPSMEIWVEN